MNDISLFFFRHTDPTGLSDFVIFVSVFLYLFMYPSVKLLQSVDFLKHVQVTTNLKK